MIIIYGLTFLIENLFGLPKNGKTLLGTLRGIEWLREGRIVYSNYPIFDPKTKRSSALWDDKKYFEKITGAYIVFDEAHTYFNSRNYKDFCVIHPDTKEKIDLTVWFATHAHKGLDILCINQDPAMIDTNIRRCTETYTFIQKVKLPFIWLLGLEYVLYFKYEYYATIEEASKRRPHDIEYRDIHRFRPKKWMYEAYNYKFFDDSDLPDPDIKFWYESEANNIFLNRVKKQIKQSFMSICKLNLKLEYQHFLCVVRWLYYSRDMDYYPVVYNGNVIESTVIVDVFLYICYLIVFLIVASFFI